MSRSSILDSLLLSRDSVAHFDSALKDCFRYFPLEGTLSGLVSRFGPEISLAVETGVLGSSLALLAANLGEASLGISLKVGFDLRNAVGDLVGVCFESVMQFFLHDKTSVDLNWSRPCQRRGRDRIQNIYPGAVSSKYDKIRRS